MLGVHRRDAESIVVVQTAWSKSHYMYLFYFVLPCKANSVSIVPSPCTFWLKGFCRRGSQCTLILAFYSLYTIMSLLIQTAVRNTENSDYAKGVLELVMWWWARERKMEREEKEEEEETVISFKSKGRQIKNQVWLRTLLLKSLLTPCAITTPLRVQGQ